MNSTMRRIAAEMLEKAASEYSNHGCNDWKWPEGMSEEDRRALSDAANADERPEERTDYADGEYGPPDWIVMLTLAKMLREADGDTPPVVLAGLVRGGEYAHFGEWTRSKATESEALCVSATGRIVTGNDDALYADYPLTWYTYPEAP